MPAIGRHRWAGGSPATFREYSVALNDEQVRRRAAVYAVQSCATAVKHHVRLADVPVVPRLIETESVDMTRGRLSQMSRWLAQA